MNLYAYAIQAWYPPLAGEVEPRVIYYTGAVAAPTREQAQETVDAEIERKFGPAQGPWYNKSSRLTPVSSATIRMALGVLVPVRPPLEDTDQP